MKQQVDCYGNAMKESLWATLKQKLVQHAKLKTRAQVRSSIFEWIKVWYQLIGICFSSVARTRSQ
jgi:hypothetical protein